MPRRLSSERPITCASFLQMITMERDDIGCKDYTFCELIHFHHHKTIKLYRNTPNCTSSPISHSKLNVTVINNRNQISLCCRRTVKGMIIQMVKIKNPAIPHVAPYINHSEEGRILSSSFISG